MARRRAPETPLLVVVDADDVPECLRAGVCVEAWAPDGRHQLDARRAYGHARDLWKQQNGVGPQEHRRMPRALMRSTAPWSYVDLRREPERLAQQLEFRGLPPTWKPAAAPKEWREPLEAAERYVPRGPKRSAADACSAGASPPDWRRSRRPAP